MAKHMFILGHYWIVDALMLIMAYVPGPGYVVSGLNSPKISLFLFPGQS